MADTKCAVGGGSRFLVRGCPRCRGTLERLDERDVGRFVTLSWHCINCGRGYSEDAFSLDSSLANRAGPFDAFSAKPATYTSGEVRAR